MYVQTRKNFRKLKTKPEAKKLERLIRACPEAVLINLAQGESYPVILKDLKKHVIPDQHPGH